MGILDRMTQKYGSKAPLKVTISQTSPDSFFKDPNAITWFYDGGTLSTGPGDVSHWNVDAGFTRQYELPSGRVSADRSMCAVWALRDKDVRLTEWINAFMALFNKGIINENTMIVGSGVIPVKVTDLFREHFQNQEQETSFSVYSKKAQLSGNDPSNEDYFGGWEEKEQVSMEVRHMFNNCAESIRNTLNKVQSIEQEMEQITKYFKDDQFMMMLYKIVINCVKDLKELHGIFYEGASGLLNLKLSMIVTSQTRRQVSIDPMAFKARSKIGLLTFDLHELGNELLFEFNGSRNSDINLSNDNRVFQWEAAYAIGIINNYIKSLNEMFQNRAWLNYQARPKDYNFMSDEAL